MWLWSPDFALVLTERDGEGLDPAAGPSGPEPGSRGAKLRTDQDLGRGRGGLSWELGAEEPRALLCPADHEQAHLPFRPS